MGWTAEIGWKPVVAKSSGKRDILFMLRPYWITTDKPLGLGYGITARSEEDAETLLRLVMSSVCAIISIKPVKDAASLDQGHVIPNMGNMLRRGIWYPLGYQHVTDWAFVRLWAVPDRPLYESTAWSIVRKYEPFVPSEVEGRAR